MRYIKIAGWVLHAPTDQHHTWYFGDFTFRESRVGWWVSGGHLSAPSVRLPSLRDAVEYAQMRSRIQAGA